MIYIRTVDFYNETNACNWLLQNIPGTKSYCIQQRPDKFLQNSLCLAWAKNKLQRILKGTTILSQKLKPGCKWNNNNNNNKCKNVV